MEDGIFKELYERYYREALLYTLSLCSHRQLAEDIVSEAFLKAYMTLEEGSGGFKFWLLKVCRNLYIDHLRREKHRAEESEAPDAGSPSPEEALLGDERRAALYRAIGALGPADREVITLFYFAGLSAERIAGLTGQTSGSVRTRLSRARARIRNIMEVDYGIS